MGVDVQNRGFAAVLETEDFAAVAASEKDVAEAIGRLKDECGYLMDPHTACGVVAAERASDPWSWFGAQKLRADRSSRRDRLL